MKTTKWTLSALLALVATAVVSGVTGCKNSDQDHSEQAHQYTCSMHPEVVQDKPGNCPKCGMKLVEKK